MLEPGSLDDCARHISKAPNRAVPLRARPLLLRTLLSTQEVVRDLQQAHEGAAPANRRLRQYRDSQRFQGALPITRLTDVEAQLDMKTLRGYRLRRVPGTEAGRHRRLPAVRLDQHPLCDRPARRAALHDARRERVPLSSPRGPVVLFGHSAEPDIGLATINEVRPQVELSHFLAGTRHRAAAQAIRREASGRRRLPANSRCRTPASAARMTAACD